MGSGAKRLIAANPPTRIKRAISNKGSDRLARRKKTSANVQAVNREQNDDRRVVTGKVARIVRDTLVSVKDKTYLDRLIRVARHADPVVVKELAHRAHSREFILAEILQCFRDYRQHSKLGAPCCA